MPFRYESFQTYEAFVQAVATQQIPIDGHHRQDISQSGKDVMRLCLQKDESRRPAASTILSFPWFSGDKVFAIKSDVCTLEKELLVPLYNHGCGPELQGRHSECLSRMISPVHLDKGCMFEEMIYSA